MPVTPPTTVAGTCQDLLYIAFREARILKRPQGVNSNNELEDGMLFLNQQINYWAARGCYAWTTTFRVFTLTPGHQPHLIGPGLLAPDFALAQRPTKISSASIVLGSNPSTDISITLRDNAWWHDQSVKTIGSTIPTDLYYEPDWPNGALYFWPVPSTGNQVRLESTVQLQQFQNLTDPYSAPQAYQSAICLTLAEEFVDIWGTEMPANLQRRAMKARDALQSNNFLPPRIATADWGTQSSPSSDFNYLTGMPPGK